MPDTQPTATRNEDAERGLIGAVLIDASALLSNRDLDLPSLSTFAFCVPENCEVWGAILHVHRSGAPVDLLTVSARLHETRAIDSAGGAAYLDKLVDATPTTAHAAHYAAEVRRAWGIRRAVEAADDLRAALERGEDPSEALTDLQTRLRPPDAAIAPVDVALYLRDPPPPHDPIFVNLIDRGDKGGIIAKAKTRKTFFAMQMAVCAASGSDFLGFLPSRQCSVLYCNYEIRSHHAWRRLHWLGRALSIDPKDIGDRLRIVNLRGVECPLESLTRLVEDMRADMVVLDPLYKVVQGGDENKAEDLKPYLAQFDQLCERTGACLWYVHHDTKGQAGDRDARDRGSGSSVLNRDFDACITLTDHVDGNDMLVMHALPRNYAPTQDVTIRWVDGCFVVSDLLPEAATSQKQPSPYKDKVRDYKRSHPDASSREIAQAVGCSQAAVRKWWDVTDGEAL